VFSTPRSHRTRKYAPLAEVINNRCARPIQPLEEPLGQLLPSLSRRPMRLIAKELRQVLPDLQNRERWRSKSPRPKIRGSAGRACLVSAVGGISSQGAPLSIPMLILNSNARSRQGALPGYFDRIGKRSCPNTSDDILAGPVISDRPRRRLWLMRDGPVSRPRASAIPYRCLRVRFKTSSRVAELSQHEADGREFQEREGVAIEIFPVLGETATTVEPRDGSFDDPTLG
jgi:hypothetical protein